MNTPEFSIHSFLMSGFASVVRKHNVDPIPLLKKHGIPHQVLIDPNITLDQVVFTQLINEAAELCQSELFGLELSEHFHFDTLGIRLDFFEGSSSLLDVPILTSYLNRIQHSAVKLSIEVRDGQILHKIDFAFADLVCCNHYCLMSLNLASALYRKHSRTLTHPTHVYLSGDYQNIEAIEEYFECQVTTNAPFNALALPTSSVFQRPDIDVISVRKSNVSFGHLFKESEHLVPLIEDIIAMHMSIGICNRESVAHSVGMHFKSLQKALSAQGTSYPKLLEKVRLKKSRTLLEATDLPIKDVAHKMGYAETAVFTRAFKKWTGLTPREWRKTSLSCLERN